jgi:hypothetical protein
MANIWRDSSRHALRRPLLGKLKIRWRIDGGSRDSRAGAPEREFSETEVTWSDDGHPTVYAVYFPSLSVD